ncbi:MAG: M23 family metallopeptidase, partial [Spirochaetota bacterium]
IRMHEGVDIFGPHGTRLLAASDSVVARVGERDRGGNIVTLYDEARDLLLYYAHLDAQLVTQGQRVRRGDPIGTMGNTGNAITTPPHLHIGIYQGSWRNDVDPWNYFVDPPLLEPDPPAFAELAGRWLSASEPVELGYELNARLVPARYVNRNPLLRQYGAGDGRSRRTSPAADADTERDERARPPRERPALAAGEAVEVIGAAGALVRVRSASGLEGFVAAERLVEPGRMVRVHEPTIARDLRGGDSFRRLEAGLEVAYVGRAGGDVVVVLPGGRLARLPESIAQF